MSREEFIRRLEEALVGEVNQSIINENLNYYNNYIIEEIKSGKREAEVLESLGDPWAIGKTIIQTQGNQGDFGMPRDDMRNNVEYYSDSSREDYGRRRQPHMRVHHFGLRSWKQRAAIIAAVVLVIAAIVVVIVGVVSLLAPIMVPLIVILILFRLFRR
jgi:hypothetical protein